jgi:hypothetical protein
MTCTESGLLALLAAALLLLHCLSADHPERPCAVHQVAHCDCVNRTVDIPNLHSLRYCGTFWQHQQQSYGIHDTHHWFQTIATLASYQVSAYQWLSHHAAQATARSTSSPLKGHEDLRQAHVMQLFDTSSTISSQTTAAPQNGTSRSLSLRRRPLPNRASSRLGSQLRHALIRGTEDSRQDPPQHRAPVMQQVTRLRLADDSEGRGV